MKHVYNEAANLIYIVHFDIDLQNATQYIKIMLSRKT